MTKRTLITGGADFLGSHLREKVNMGNPDEFTILEPAKK
jgi:nucleoside-diphosphate-sugar epimerase